MPEQLERRGSSLGGLFGFLFQSGDTTENSYMPPSSPSPDAALPTPAIDNTSYPPIDNARFCCTLPRPLQELLSDYRSLLQPLPTTTTPPAPWIHLRARAKTQSSN